MPRRAKPKTQRRDWRKYATIGVNGLVVVSLLIGTVFVFITPPTTPAQVTTETVVVPTLIVAPITPTIITLTTLTPTPAAPTPTATR